MVVAIIAEATGTITFAMFISAVHQMVVRQFMSNEYRVEQRRLGEYMRSVNLPEKVRKRVKQQFAQMVASNDHKYDYEALLAHLPTTLAIELTNFIHRNDVLHMAIFRQMEHNYPGK